MCAITPNRSKQTSLCIPAMKATTRPHPPQPQHAPTQHVLKKPTATEARKRTRQSEPLPLPADVAPSHRCASNGETRKIDEDVFVHKLLQAIGHRSHVGGALIAAAFASHFCQRCLMLGAHLGRMCPCVGMCIQERSVPDCMFVGWLRMFFAQFGSVGRSSNMFLKGCACRLMGGF